MYRSDGKAANHSKNGGHGQKFWQVSSSKQISILSKIVIRSRAICVNWLHGYLLNFCQDDCMCLVVICFAWNQFCSVIFISSLLQWICNVLLFHTQVEFTETQTKYSMCFSSYVCIWSNEVLLGFQDLRIKNSGWYNIG